MPSIRLIDIPNAPTAGQPNLARGGASMPDMPSVPRDAALDSSSLARGAANLRERPVDSGAVNAGVLALQDLGQAVKEAAGVPADFSLRLQRAQNTADIARADVIMRDAFAAHQDRMQGMPEDQWEPTWKTEGMKSVREQIEKLGLSEAARAQLTPDLIQWEGATSIQVRTQATKQKIGNNRLAVRNAVDRAILDDDYELGISHFRNGVKSGLFSPEEGDAGIVQIEERVKAKAKEDQASGIASAIETDPGSAIPELEKAARGEASGFGEIEPLKAKRFLAMAKDQDRNQKRELRHDLLNRTLSGEILDPETLRREAGGKLDEKALLSIEKAMGKEIAFSPEEFARIRTAITGYDAEADQDGAKYNALMSAIETTIPQKRQGLLAAELDKAWKDARDGKGETKKKHSFFSQIESMATRGVFVPFSTKEKGAPEVIDEGAKLQNWKKAEEVTNAMEEYFKKNPDASEDDTIKHFSSLLKPDLQQAVEREMKDRVKGSEKKSWWFGHADNISAGSLTADRKQPDTVRNNNPGGMWYVGSWQSKYGATSGEALNDGLGQGNQIAKFPDAVSGAAAQMHLLSNYGNVSVRDAINKWSGGNSVASYLAGLRDGGFSEDESLPDILADPARAAEFVRLMAKHEAGKDFPLNADQWMAAHKKFKEIKG